MRVAAGDMEIAASRRDRCATMSSIGSEATGAWLRRHAIAEDMGRTSHILGGDSSPVSFAPRTFTTGMPCVSQDETDKNRRPRKDEIEHEPARQFNGSSRAHIRMRAGQARDLSRKSGF